MAIGLGTDVALAAGLYYLVHSTLAAAAFFLLGDWVRRHRDGGDALGRVASMARPAWLGGFFVLLAMAAAGLPPFGGFLSKSLLLAYAVPEGATVVLWVVVLGTSLLNLLALARAGSRLFWQTPAVVTARSAALPPPLPALGERVAMLMLVFGLVVTTVMASDVTRYVAGSAAQLSEPATYREAVLGRDPLPTTVPR
jgi:multicomponent K+:H+ antiporter subunit D